MQETVREEVIRPSRGLFDLGLREIWDYRELLYFFVWKEIKIRYRQTAIGAAWAVLQPLFTMLVYWFIFGNLAGIKTDFPYPLFVFTNIILWIYFSTSITQASTSLVGNSNLISKVYFPRLLLPLAACCVGLIDYIIGVAILFALMVYFNVAITVWLLLCFLPLTIMFILACGLGFWLSTISIKYRDVQYAIPFVIQMLMFASPVIYPSSMLGNSTSQYVFLLNLNPLTAIMTLQRQTFLGAGGIDAWVYIYSFIVSIVIFLTGVIYFKSHERKMTDVI